LFHLGSFTGTAENSVNRWQTAQYIICGTWNVSEMTHKGKCYVQNVQILQGVG